LTVHTCSPGIDARAPVRQTPIRALDARLDELGTTVPQIDTGRVRKRRNIRYQCFDDFLADAEQLAERPVRELGNWTLAQIFDHLARSMNVSVDGTRERFPWTLRVALRLARKRIIGRPMKPGYHVPETWPSYCDPTPSRACANRCGNSATQRLDFKPHQSFRRIRRLAR
jgi:hypothetical protein